MLKIHIKTSREYDVIIEKNSLILAGKLIAKTLNNTNNIYKIVIISDENVFLIYGSILIDSLKLAGFEVIFFTFLAGEKSKTLSTYGKILNFLAQNNICRNDILIALGGGVTGDLVGFVAATYLRGVNYLQIPTTLLAAVDSSVGGKTAINLDYGKNLAGCFYQPSMVICDPNVFTTLTPEIYSDGCAEVIKYAFINNKNFILRLQQTPINYQFEQVIATCVSIKRDIVYFDEFDTGKRQLLNFGHTFGHAIEKSSNFTISHGKAVAIGMVIITRAAVNLGLCKKEVLDKLLSILDSYSLPTKTSFSINELYKAALSDKKISCKEINLVVPQKIGECIIKKIPVDDLKIWLNAGNIT